MTYAPILALAIEALFVTAETSNTRRGAAGPGPFEDFVAFYVKAGDFSGNVLVARNGKVLFHRSYGDANYELKVPNGPGSKFHIASVSKTFTAAAVSLLERAGRLALSDRLSKYVQGYPPGDKITLTNLLAHSAGVPDYYAIPEYSGMKRNPVTFEQLLSVLKDKPLDFDPGTQSRYSNSGYAFLAEVVAKASGTTYDRFVRERLLAPAGMKSSGIWRDQPVIPLRASGYQPWIGAPELRNAPFYDKTILAGSGSLYSTADDLWAWYRFLRSQKLLSGPAYGWGPRKKDGREYLEQNGRDPGFVSHMSVYPREDLVVIVLGNLEVASDSELADGLAAIALGNRPATPKARPAFAPPAESLADYIGRFEVAPGFVMDILTARGHLFLRGTGGDFLPMDPTGKDRFFYRQLYVTVGFQREETGRVNALLWGGDYPCKRIGDPPREAAEDLRLAVGEDSGR